MRELGAKVDCPECQWPFSVVLPRHPSSTLIGFARWRSCESCGCVYETVESATRVVGHKSLDVARQTDQPSAE
jgi:transcriptional regulator NrdR family protein